MVDDVSKVFRVRKTLFEMLVDRGYLVSNEDLKMSLDDFKNKFGDDVTKLSRDKLTILANRRDDPTGTDQIYVFFADEANLGVKPIRNYVKRMEEGKVGRALIIVQAGITAFAKQPKLNIELFQEAELLVNITEHILVPKHNVLTPDEKAALLKKYKLKQTQLPRIQLNDPIARYYGMTKGQVVKIIRPSETAGRYVTYRLVV